MSNNILVFCAHPDDEILGVGGTISKYAAEGKNVISVIFCYGELSHPWMKKHIITDVRIKESKKAAEVVGSKPHFFGLDEKDAIEKLRTHKVKTEVEDLLREYRPIKIFTHSHDDPHPIHREVYETVVHAADKLRQKNVYVFDIWNPMNIKKRKHPKLYVDITKTFSKKIDALRVFKSQKIQMQIPLLWSVYVKAIKAGIENGSKFAEVFYKMR